MKQHISPALTVLLFLEEFQLNRPLEIPDELRGYDITNVLAPSYHGSYVTFSLVASVFQ
jgi:hypothetical protein